MPKQSASTPKELLPDDLSSVHRHDEHTFRMVMTNVELENDQYDRWVGEIARVDPDLVLAVEVNDQWVDATAEFREQYPYQVIEPRDNWYGMMLMSKLPISESAVRFLVQEDVPSIDARIRLDNGLEFRFVGVHPRPPEPIRGNNATARDAELTLWGRELQGEEIPVVIGGDLNDVAWSQTTRLFLRTTGLLDPRRGRGFYNTFHAAHWYMRFPLDHVFHSKDFTISRLERLGDVGSDHFPIAIDLRYTPTQSALHQPLSKKPADNHEADLRIERAVQSEEFEGDAVSDDQSGVN